MSKGIRISEKYGLNPSITTCFWCGKDVGVALFGRTKGDVEAPKRICLDLEPCDECQKRFAEGVHFIEVTPDGSRYGNSPKFAFRPEGEAIPMYPTGRFAVVKATAVKDGKPGMKFLCDKEAMDKILGNAEQV